MKLEEGKRYITRGGEITEPLQRRNGHHSSTPYIFRAKVGKSLCTYTCDGAWSRFGEDHRDLVRECVEVGSVEYNRQFVNEKNPFNPSGHDESAPVEESANDLSRVFETGSKRDSAEGKPRVADLKPYTRLRFGYHMLLGSEKYGEGNFELGQPDKSSLESIHRHLAMYELGDRSEDHLSAIAFGVQLIMQNEQREGVEPDHYYRKLKK